MNIAVQDGLDFIQIGVSGKTLNINIKEDNNMEFWQEIKISKRMLYKVVDTLKFLERDMAQDSESKGVR